MYDSKKWTVNIRTLSYFIRRNLWWINNSGHWSTDSTKDIAHKYTDKVYDYKWCDDFAAARNYAFSLASCDYIFSADADEILDERNNQALKDLKSMLLPEIDIVQMYYVNDNDYNSVYNVHRELRPKLFKR